MDIFAVVSIGLVFNLLVLIVYVAIECVYKYYIKWCKKSNKKLTTMLIGMIPATVVFNIVLMIMVIMINSRMK